MGATRQLGGVPQRPCQVVSLQNVHDLLGRLHSSPSRDQLSTDWHRSAKPGRGSPPGNRQGTVNRVGQILWPPPGRFHGRQRAAIWPSAGSFSWPSSIVAFLTPAGQRGGAHSDPTDVDVIQLEGTKRWQIWPTPQARRPGEDTYFDSLPDPVLDLSVQPGDVLYIPYSTPHRASAEGSVSLHVTVVAGPRSWAHHLLSAVQDILHNGPEFWDTPYLDGTSPEELAPKIEQLIGRLRAVDTAAVLERAQRDGRAFRGVRQAALFQEMAAADGIDADTKLLAVDGAATFRDGADGTAQVTILGNTLAMPQAAAAALRSASTSVPFPAGEFLPGADFRRSLPVARQLLRLGALRIA
ncbi:MAG TPA: cupin domain-containing protein [Streptosporangiaceae bacterium]|nr:cupin domain-containing protein [Streptosporangiaceae bacterium]